jgi:hypothetical protein
MKTRPVLFAALAPLCALTAVTVLAAVATANDGSDEWKPPAAESQWAPVTGSPVVDQKRVHGKRERTSAPASAVAPSSEHREKDLPSEADWKKAPDANVARDVRDDCRAQALGEWLRVTCSGRAGYISPSVIIAAGPSDDVITEFSENWLRVTFPVRSGDRRVLLASGRIEISALWLRGDAAPTIVLE